MRTFVIAEIGGNHRTRTLQYDGIRLIIGDAGNDYALHHSQPRLDVETATPWEILSLVTPVIAMEVNRRIALDELAQRCRKGWKATPGEIPSKVHQRTLSNAKLAVDGLAYPDDMDGLYYLPATRIMGIATDGGRGWTGEILWIAADQSYAVCDNGFYWLPST